MDRPRNQLLAGPAFPLQEHRALALGHPSHQLIHFQHSGTASHQRSPFIFALQLFTKPGILSDESAVIETPLDHQLDILFLKRLGEIVVGPLLNRFDRTFKRSERGQHHDRRVRTHAFKLTQDRKPIDRAHTNICQHQIHAPLASTSDDLFSTGEGFNGIAFLL